MRTYVSGKITGLEIVIAKQLFQNAVVFLTLEFAHETINPFDLFTEEEERTFTWWQFMLRDLEHLSTCDAVYMLKNWKESRGARLEHAAAIESDMVIIYEK